VAKKFIYIPAVNLFVRTVLSPFKSIVPVKYRFPVTGKITVKLPESKSFIFSGNETSPHTRQMFWYGIEGFEYGTLNVFIHLIKQSKCFFDIGANIGYYSLTAACYNTKTNIYAFEPLPAALKYLKINIALNHFNNIVANDLALSNSKGEAVFYSYLNPKFKHISEHLRGDSSLVIGDDIAGERIEFKVETQTLDEYVKLNLKSEQKIDLLKIDTEGSENLVFEGGQMVLSEHRPIIMCEIIKGGIEKIIDSQLSTHNYKFYLIDDKGLIHKTKIEPESIKEDYFCVPQEKVSLIESFILKK